MNVSPSDELLKAAAGWWADLLRKPPVHNVSDAKLNTAANTYHVNSELVPESAIEAFSNNLYTLLKFYFDNPYHTFSKAAFQHDDFLYLSVDYHPCLTLEACAEGCAIDLERRLPLKTKMWVYSDRVEVAQGYGAKNEVLLVAV